jgi:hypothetical protein
MPEPGRFLGIQDPEKPTTDHISARIPRPLHEAHPYAISRLSKRRSLPLELKIAMLEPIPNDKYDRSRIRLSNLKILAGHGRVEAAKVVGMTTVPTIRLSDMSEAERKAYVIADNAIALKAGWDREILAIEMQELIDVGFEVELTGFETAAVSTNTSCNARPDHTGQHVISHLPCELTQLYTYIEPE